MQGIIRKEDMHESFWQNGVSNPNLLINGDFQVWQRGTEFSQITNRKYFADRWIMGYNYTSLLSDISKVNNGFKIKGKAGSQHLICQMLEASKLSSLYNRPLTLSLEYEIVSGDAIINVFIRTDKPQYTFGSGDGDRIESTPAKNNGANEGKLTSTLSSMPNNYLTCFAGISIYSATDYEIVIRNVKLELGDRATPFYPRLYEEELALCQRYYFAVKNMFANGYITSSAKSFQFFVPTPVMMRESKTLKSYNCNNIRLVEGNSKTPTWIAGAIRSNDVSNHTNGLNIYLTADTQISTINNSPASAQDTTVEVDAEIY